MHFSIFIKSFIPPSNGRDVIYGQPFILYFRGMKRYALLAKFVQSGSCLAIKSDQMDEQVNIIT